MQEEHSTKACGRAMPNRGQEVARLGDPAGPCITLPTRTFACLFAAYLALGGDPAELGPQLAALAARHPR